VDTCAFYNIPCGVYGSVNSWTGIFGTTEFVYGNDMPIWYPHYDNNTAYYDFKPFGGWTAPHAKQYLGDNYLCDTKVDADYAEVEF
jgi:hypothetical protein